MNSDTRELTIDELDATRGGELTNCTITKVFCTIFGLTMGTMSCDNGKSYLFFYRQ
jgi:hypothetical protein